MKVRIFFVCIWFMLSVADFAKAKVKDTYSIPKVSFTYDFNAPFSDDKAIGPRIQVISNNNYFGDNNRYKRKLNENTIAYTYGLGFGGYRVNSLKKEIGSNNDLYFLYGLFTVCYQNETMIEPFAGVCSGIAWEAKSGVFMNPVAGINITALRVRRNWNSLLFQLYGQIRIEYNTLLSTPFLGCGIVLKIL